MTHNGSRGPRARLAHLFGDNEWIPFDGAKDGFTADPTDPKNWQIEPFHQRAEECAIIIPDFEAPGYHAWKDHQYEALARLIGEVRGRHPDVLIGLWQASRSKDIIEAATTWEILEVHTSRNNAWRVGDERYPSYVNLRKEPLVRSKLSADGRTLLVVACNPHNAGVEQVHVRRPGFLEEYGFELAGDFPILRRFPVAQALNAK